MIIESKAFLRFLLVLGLIWCLLGILLFSKSPPELRVFFRAYEAVLLDLVFLVLLFWELFFASKPVRKIRVFLYFTFKLVCLGFLAITLKRLRNDPPLPAAMAVLFMGAGPLFSAILMKWRLKTK